MTNEYTTGLEEGDKDKNNAIEESKMVLELMEMSWDRFLALEIEIDKKIQATENDNVSKLVKQSKRSLI